MSAFAPDVADGPLLDELASYAGLPIWLVVDRDARRRPHVAAFVEIRRAELESTDRRASP
jgi:hypothetical protein